MIITYRIKFQRGKSIVIQVWDMYTFLKELEYYLKNHGPIDWMVSE